MKDFQNKLRAKILADTGIAIPATAKLHRRNLSWNAKSVGRLKWYWFIIGAPTVNGTIVGSQEGMRDLIKCNKIEALSTHGQVELSSS